MTRRGLFKMLAATPLAGIVAKFAPKPEPVYWRGGPYLTMEEFQKAYIEPAVEHWTRIPGEICNCGRCKGGVWSPRTREEIQASFAAMDSLPKIGSTLNIRRPNRANIQS